MSGPGDANSVGERLRALRRRLGLSQEQLARRLGVSFATVNRWESGRTQLSARSLTALAELEASAADGQVQLCRPGTGAGRADRPAAAVATIDDKTWLASGVGPVQSELISVDGGKADLTSKEELTSFVKG